MEALRQYAAAVVTAALISGVLLSIVHNGSSRELIRLLCSLFLAITVIGPLVGREWDFEAYFAESLKADGFHQASVGEKMAQQAAAEIISSETQAYILDKAAQLGASLTVTVTLGEDNLPVSAELRGRVTPQSREELSHILADDLGISKENQLWTG